MFLGVVAGLSAASATTVLAPPAAIAAPVADCTPRAGVLVVVDFSHWGGDLVRGCSTGGSGGLEAMKRAGLITAGDASDGAAFVCRIGLASRGLVSERPTPSEDPCITTPPADAYWSFWFADAGARSWTYSLEGVETFMPTAGSIEAWEFGSGKPPRETPSQARAASSGSNAGTTGGPGSVDAARSGGGVAGAQSGGGSAGGFAAAAIAVIAICALAATVARRRKRIAGQ